jgi:hypothetical protein
MAVTLTMLSAGHRCAVWTFPEGRIGNFSPQRPTGLEDSVQGLNRFRPRDWSFGGQVKEFAPTGL